MLFTSHMKNENQRVATSHGEDETHSRFTSQPCRETQDSYMSHE